MGQLPLLLLLLSALSLSEGRRVSRCKLRDGIVQYYKMPLEYLPREYKHMLARVVCEVERRSLNSLKQEKEDDNSDLDDSTTSSPTTDLPEPPATFSAAAASESDPEWNHFRKQEVRRTKLRRWQQRHKEGHKGWTQRRWRGKPGRSTANPPRTVFPPPPRPTPPGPNVSLPSRPTPPGPNVSRPNPPTTADNSADSTSLRRKRDVQLDNLFGVYPVHCSDDFVDGDISKEVECFAESGMIEIAYWEARGFCTSSKNMDSFFKECESEEEEEEEGFGEDFPFEEDYE